MNAMEVVIQIVPLNTKWIVDLSLDQTLQENLKMFFKIIKDEVRAEFLYSEQMAVIESRCGEYLDPYVPCKNFEFYTGILLYVL